MNPRGVENVFVALFFPPFVWRVSSFLPAVCSGCEGLACSFWRTAAARSRSCPTSPASDITRLKGESDKNKTKWSDAIVLGLDRAARRHLLDHLVALSAVHAQQRAPVLHVGMKHLQDLLGGQLFAHPLVLTCGHTHTNNTSDTLAWLDLAVCVCGRESTHTSRAQCASHMSSHIRSSGFSPGSPRTLCWCLPFRGFCGEVEQCATASGRRALRLGFHLRVK